MLDVHEMLSRVARHLTADDLPKIAAPCRRISLGEGQQLLGEGRYNDSLCVLVEGRLGVELEAAGRVSLAECQPGACVGEMTWVDPGPANATVRALVPSVLYQLTHGDLEAMRVSDPGALSRLLQAVVEDLAGHLRAGTARLSSAESTDNAVHAVSSGKAQGKRGKTFGKLVDAIAALGGLR